MTLLLLPSLADTCISLWVGGWVAYHTLTTDTPVFAKPQIRGMTGAGR
ncbi:MAG: hypothetical protein L3J06_08285 [Cyclobacteriaceae bacterium]|nr:hypothetical protein [Cyclobacteriaceae bacterium]